jgi:hypothetical protein
VLTSHISGAAPKWTKVKRANGSYRFVWVVKQGGKWLVIWFSISFDKLLEANMIGVGGIISLVLILIGILFNRPCWVLCFC